MGRHLVGPAEGGEGFGPWPRKALATALPEALPEALPLHPVHANDPPLDDPDTSPDRHSATFMQTLDLSSHLCTRLYGDSTPSGICVLNSEFLRGLAFSRLARRAAAFKYSVRVVASRAD